MLIDEALESYLKSIELCFDKEYYIPGTILIFCCIDLVASLSRPKDREEVTKTEFVNWIDKYFLPKSNLKCSAVDLYASRCSLCHTYSAESSLSRKGEAKEISFCDGKMTVQRYQRILNKVHGNFVAVHYSDFRKALDKGLKTFYKELEKF